MGGHSNAQEPSTWSQRRYRRRSLAGFDLGVGHLMDFAAPPNPSTAREWSTEVRWEISRSRPRARLHQRGSSHDAPGRGQSGGATRPRWYLDHCSRQRTQEPTGLLPDRKPRQKCGDLRGAERRRMCFPVEHDVTKSVPRSTLDVLHSAIYIPRCYGLACPICSRMPRSSGMFCAGGTVG